MGKKIESLPNEITFKSTGPRGVCTTNEFSSEFQIPAELLEKREKNWNKLFAKYSTKEPDNNEDIAMNDSLEDIQIQVNRAPMRKPMFMVQYWINTGMQPYTIINNNKNCVNSRSSFKKSPDKPTTCDSPNNSASKNHSKSDNKKLNLTLSSESTIHTGEYIKSNNNVTKGSDAQAIVQHSKIVCNSKTSKNTFKKPMQVIVDINNCKDKIIMASSSSSESIIRNTKNNKSHQNDKDVKKESQKRKIQTYTLPCSDTSKTKRKKLFVEHTSSVEFTPASDETCKKFQSQRKTSLLHPALDTPKVYPKNIYNGKRKKYLKRKTQPSCNLYNLINSNLQVNGLQLMEQNQDQNNHSNTSEMFSSHVNSKLDNDNKANKNECDSRFNSHKSHIQKPDKQTVSNNILMLPEDESSNCSTISVYLKSDSDKKSKKKSNQNTFDDELYCEMYQIKPLSVVITRLPQNNVRRKTNKNILDISNSKINKQSNKCKIVTSKTLSNYNLASNNNKNKSKKCSRIKNKSIDDPEMQIYENEYEDTKKTCRFSVQYSYVPVMSSSDESDTVASAAEKNKSKNKKSEKGESSYIQPKDKDHKNTIDNKKSNFVKTKVQSTKKPSNDILGPHKTNQNAATKTVTKKNKPSTNMQVISQTNNTTLLAKKVTKMIKLSNDTQESIVTDNNSQTKRAKVLQSPSKSQKSFEIIEKFAFGVSNDLQEFTESDLQDFTITHAHPKYASTPLTKKSKTGATHCNVNILRKKSSEQTSTFGTTKKISSTEKTQLGTSYKYIPYDSSDESDICATEKNKNKKSKRQLR